MQPIENRAVRLSIARSAHEKCVCVHNIYIMKSYVYITMFM